VAALKKKRKLQESCKRAKVRTYACEADGFRTVKYFNYEFDFDMGKCVEKVLTKEMPCDTSVAPVAKNSEPISKSSKPYAKGKFRKI
jgi:hypothetical protein